LNAGDTARLNSILRSSEYRSGPWRVLFDGGHMSHYSYAVSGDRTESRLMQGYAEIHEFLHILERFLSEQLNEDPSETSVLSGLTAYTEGLSMVLPKALLWQLCQDAGTEEEAAWYRACAMFYYTKDSIAKCSILWERGVEPEKYPEKIREILRSGGLIPHPAFLQEEYDMGSITPEYIKQALGLQQLLDIYDYDVSRVVRHLIKAQPVITPIRSGDVKPLEGYAGIKATAEALETAWAALLEYESTGSFQRKTLTASAPASGRTSEQRF